MLSFTLRRLAMAIPTLLAISVVLFAILSVAPGDPMSTVPSTVPDEIKQRMREALGLTQPPHVQYLKWLRQLLWVEPLALIDRLTESSLLLGWLPDTRLAHDELRILSWQTHTPAVDIIVQRLPQTLWVVGLAYVIGVIVAFPVGVLSAYRRASAFDRVSTAVMMLGFSLPVFFSGPLLITLFAIRLEWVPSIYDTTHRVTDWASFRFQLAQIALPVSVLALQTTAQISRYLRASILDTLPQDYIRTARAKGVSDLRVITDHALRNAIGPVVTVIALGVPSIFGGAIITESVFQVNGIGHLLITWLDASDLPGVLTVTFVFAALIVLSNLVADILYGVIDPRVLYD